MGYRWTQSGGKTHIVGKNDYSLCLFENSARRKSNRAYITSNEPKQANYCKTCLDLLNRYGPDFRTTKGHTGKSRYMRYSPEYFKPQKQKKVKAPAKDPVAKTRAAWVNSPEFLQSAEWRALRYKVITKRGARCECCGATPADGVRMNVDHIKPRWKYPELALVEANLQVLCEVCNHGKGSWDETDWRKRE